MNYHKSAETLFLVLILQLVSIFFWQQSIHEAQFGNINFEEFTEFTFFFCLSQFFFK